MTVRSRKGAALGYVLVVGTLLFLLAAALLPIASGLTEATANSADGKISYIDAKSAIEYAKAVMDRQIAADNKLQSFYVTGAPAADGTIAFDYVLGTPSATDSYYALCTVTEDTVRIDAATSRLDRQGSSLDLLYGYTPGTKTVMQTIPTGYAQIGEYIGDDLVLERRNSSYTYNQYFDGNDYGIFGVGADYRIVTSPRVYNLMPIVFKNTVNLKGVYYMLMGKSLYFMGVPAIAADHAYLELMTNVIYLSGTINATDSKLMIQVPDDYSEGNSVYILFNNVTIVSKVPGKASQSIDLDGVYEYVSKKGSNRNKLDLFNINSLQTNTDFRKLSGSALNAALKKFDGNILTSTAEQRANWITGEEAGWMTKGRINGGQSDQTGKSVFMYITDTATLNNYASLTYTAKTIRIRTYILMDGTSHYYLNIGKKSGGSYSKQTVTFNTSYICFENFDNIDRMEKNSQLIIAVPQGKTTLVEFNQDTLIRKRNPSGSNYTLIGTIRKGIYEITETIDLFDESLYNTGWKFAQYTGEATVPVTEETLTQLGEGIYAR